MYMLEEKSDRPGVLNLRDVPQEVIARLKAAASLKHKTLKEYVVELFQAHLRQLERDGVLPRQKER